MVIKCRKDVGCSMSKSVVIYKSKYGSTKKYAEWISTEIGADLFEASRINAKELSKYDTIIFGGFLHAVGISGVKIITDNFKELMNKKIIVFAVGCSPGRENEISQVLSKNFTEGMKEKISFFYLRGAFNYNKLDFVDKMMMNALKIKLKKMREENLDEDARVLLECYDNPVDWTNKEAITPIIESLRY